MSGLRATIEHLLNYLYEDQIGEHNHRQDAKKGHRQRDKSQKPGNRAKWDGHSEQYDTQ
jgi:hypothetical protein